MRPALLLTLLLAASASNASDDPTCDPAGSQSRLNACTDGEYAANDAKLNATYRAVLAKHADQPVFIDNLKASQRLWIKFRDAELKVKFPIGKSDDPKFIYGSVYPMCVGHYLAELTRQRTAQLQAWIDGIPEGDVCTGSLPINGDPD